MENISHTTGGAYIPPSKLKLMQERITDKSSEAYQKLAWDALKKTINGLINKVNVDNFDIIIKKLLSENVIRGRGILARTIIVAQSESPALTHVHAALVAVINSKFPQIGSLIITRLLNDFQKSYKRNDKKRCLTSSRFFAHLVNQEVVNPVIIMELLFLLLEKTSNNSVEIAVGIMKEVGLKLEETSKASCMALFDKFRQLLNEGTLDKRVNYMIEVLFQIRKDKYTDYPIVKSGLNLVDPDDQTTHLVDLLSECEVRDELNVFQLDAEFLENERRYEEMKEEILPESDDEDEEGDEEEGEEEGPVMTVEIQDQSFMSTVELRKKIYLKIHSALTHMDAAHLLLQLPLKPDQLYEMASMILDCCAQLRIYDNKFGYLAQQMCLVNHKYVEEFEKLFCENYGGIHRLDMTKIRNLAMFFAHLICTDTVSWGILVVVKLTERDTTSSGRIFLKHMFQEMRTTLTLDGMIARFKEEEMQVYFANIFPKDDLKDTKFAINYFTAIDLGKITIPMREYFDEAKAAKLDDKKGKKQKSEEEDKSSSSSNGSKDSSSDDSSDDESSSMAKEAKKGSKKTEEGQDKRRKENKGNEKNQEDRYDDRRERQEKMYNLRAEDERKKDSENRKEKGREVDDSTEVRRRNEDVDRMVQRGRKEDEERRRKDDDERRRKDDDRRKKDDDEKGRKDDYEKRRNDEYEKRRKDDERRKKDDDERRRMDDYERRRKDDDEKRRKDDDERRRKDDDERRKKDDKEKRRKEEEDRDVRGKKRDQEERRGDRTRKRHSSNTEGSGMIKAKNLKCNVQEKDVSNQIQESQTSNLEDMLAILRKESKQNKLDRSDIKKKRCSSSSSSSRSRKSSSSSDSSSAAKKIKR